MECVGSLLSTEGGLDADADMFAWRLLLSREGATEPTPSGHSTGSNAYCEWTVEVDVPAGVTLRVLPVLTFNASKVHGGTYNALYVITPIEDRTVDVLVARGTSFDPGNAVRVFDHQVHPRPVEYNKPGNVSAVSSAPAVTVPLWVAEDTSGTVTEAAHRFTSSGTISVGLYASFHNIRFRLEVWGFPVR